MAIIDRLLANSEMNQLAKIYETAWFAGLYRGQPGQHMLILRFTRFDSKLPCEADVPSDVGVISPSTSRNWVRLPV